MSCRLSCKLAYGTGILILIIMRVYEVQEDFFWYNKWDKLVFNDWQIPIINIPITWWDKDLCRIFKDVSKETYITFNEI